MVPSSLVPTTNEHTRATNKVACVASVSVGLFAGLKLFLPFERISVALAPIFAPPKREKCLERAEKPTETLPSQATNKETAHTIGD